MINNILIVSDTVTMKTLIIACLLVAMVTFAHSASLREQDEIDEAELNELEQLVREKRGAERMDEGLEVLKRIKRGQKFDCPTYKDCPGSGNGLHWCCILCGYCH